MPKWPKHCFLPLRYEIHSLRTSPTGSTPSENSEKKIHPSTLTHLKYLVVPNCSSLASIFIKLHLNCYVPISSTQTEKYEYRCFYTMYLFSPIHIYTMHKWHTLYSIMLLTKYLLPLLSLLTDPKYAVVPSCLFLSLIRVCDDNLQPLNDVVVHSVSCTCRWCVQ